MAVFVYTGKSLRGQVLHGEVVADTAKLAIAILRKRQILVTRLEEKCKGLLHGGNWLERLRAPRVKSQDLLAFTQQFATMLKAGIPLLECLSMLERHSGSSALRQILTQVRRDVERGVGLAEALKKHPYVFNEFYVNMIEVGEATGLMDSILIRLGTYIERQATLKGKVFSALAYPATLFGVAIFVFLFMLIWVVPLFDQMFAELGDALPWLTQVVLDVSLWIQSYVHLIGMVFIALISVGVRFGYTDQGKHLIDRLLLTLPLIHRVVRASTVVQFTRTLGMLLNSGVSILDGLLIAGKVSGNRIVEEVIKDVRMRIREGETIAKPLSRSHVFPPMVTQMIHIGETTGSLDTLLDQIADFYEQELNRTISIFTSMLEPAVILLIGLGIGLLVVAMYLPLFTMGSLI